MKIFIIEDELLSIDWLKEQLSEIEPESKIIGEAQTVQEAVHWLRKTQDHPDLIFIDIQLADGLSFEIFDQVDVLSPVIFTTAYDTYLLEAFKVHSIDYLLKPINAQELRRSIEKYKRFYDRSTNKSQRSEALNTQDEHQQQVPEGNISNEHILRFIKQFALEQLQEESSVKRILVQHGSKLHSIGIDEIAFCYAEQKLVYVVTHENKRYIKGDSLDELQTLLPQDSFFRLNRQFLANIHAILDAQMVDYGKITVRIAPMNFQQAQAIHTVFVSRERATQFKKWYGD